MKHRLQRSEMSTVHSLSGAEQRQERKAGREGRVWERKEFLRESRALEWEGSWSQGKLGRTQQLPATCAGDLRGGVPAAREGEVLTGDGWSPPVTVCRGTGDSVLQR